MATSSAAASPSLSPPGSASYSSNTLHVGDGTWDASTDTFLLPNIQGLNLATTQYNGMGNRFSSLSEYHSIVLGHGVLAAITFLGIIPTAILVASFYHRNPHFALRLHISLQVITVFLTTVIFVLGYFAVGPERSLTNPHHAIGLALYVLILVQAIGGWIIKKIEKGKVRYFIPIKLMLHQWMGRAITILGFAQVPIGLALYGSPESLFIVYTLWMTFLLVLYFYLVHQNHKRVARGYDDRGSLVTGSRSDFTQSHVQGAETEHDHTTRHRMEGLAGAVGLGAALTALRKRRNSMKKNNNQYYDSRTDLSAAPHGGHRPMPSGSEYSDEKYSESEYTDKHKHTWRNRILGTAAGIGGVAAARKYFQRRKVRDDDALSEYSAHPPPGAPGAPVGPGGSYQPPPQPNSGPRPYPAQPMGAPNITGSTWNVNQMEEGMGMPPPPPPGGMPGQYAQAPFPGNNQPYGNQPYGYQNQPYGNQPYPSSQFPPQSVSYGGPQAPPHPQSSGFARSGVDPGDADHTARMRGSRPDLQSQSHAMSDEEYSEPPTPARTRSWRSKFGIPATLAGIGGIGNYFKRRKDQRDDEYVSDLRHTDHENERMYSRPDLPQTAPIPDPYTDNTPQRPQRGRVGSMSPATTQRQGSPGRSRVAFSDLPPQESTGNISGMTPRNAIPPPPRGTRMGPPPPAHHSPPTAPGMSYERDIYDSPPRSRGPSRNNRRNASREPVVQNETPISSPPAAAAASTSLLSPPPPAQPPFAPAAQQDSARSSPHANVESPPISVKVRMHEDGRHVTLRRLSEQEAAQERERRTPRQATPGATPGASPAPQQLSSPPDTIGASSDMTDFDSNRRRRRAERARAEVARRNASGAATGAGGPHVEFT